MIGTGDRGFRPSREAGDRPPSFLQYVDPDPRAHRSEQSQFGDRRAIGPVPAGVSRKSNPMSTTPAEAPHAIRNPCLSVACNTSWVPPPTALEWPSSATRPASVPWANHRQQKNQRPADAGHASSSGNASSRRSGRRPPSSLQTRLAAAELSHPWWPTASRRTQRNHEDPFRQVKGDGKETDLLGVVVHELQNQ